MDATTQKKKAEYFQKLTDTADFLFRQMEASKTFMLYDYLDIDKIFKGRMSEEEISSFKQEYRQAYNDRFRTILP